MQYSSRSVSLAEIRLPLQSILYDVTSAPWAAGARQVNVIDVAVTKDLMEVDGMAAGEDGGVVHEAAWLKGPAPALLIA